MVQFFLFLVLGVFPLGVFYWLKDHRNPYIEHMLKALHDGFRVLTLGYIVYVVLLYAFTSLNEQYGLVGPTISQGLFVRVLVSLTDMWVLMTIVMAFFTAGVGRFAEAFVKNALVYPSKLFWGAILIVGPAIIAMGVVMCGLSLFSAFNDQSFRTWFLP